MRTPTAIHSVCINHADNQTRLTPDGSLGVITSNLGIIDLRDVADVLADPVGWIEYDTTVTFVEDEDAEPWKVGGAEPRRRARSRIYARHVSEVMVVYDEVAS